MIVPADSEKEQVYQTYGENATVLNQISCANAQDDKREDVQDNNLAGADKSTNRDKSAPTDVSNDLYIMLISL